MWNAAVSIAPIKLAQGIQMKVLEAIGTGLPVVVTRAVLEGLPTEVTPACRVADAPESFAQEVIELLELTPAERRAAAERVDFGPLSWKTRLADLEGVLTRAAQS